LGTLGLVLNSHLHSVCTRYGLYTQKRTSITENKAVAIKCVNNVKLRNCFYDTLNRRCEWAIEFQ
jgi:hypothetical protein